MLPCAQERPIYYCHQLPALGYILLHYCSSKDVGPTSSAPGEPRFRSAASSLQKPWTEPSQPCADVMQFHMQLTCDFASRIA